MSIEPRTGLVVHFNYLWKSEDRDGQETSRDNHPCVIMRCMETPSGDKLVYLCPITHTPPKPGQTAVELGPKTKAHLGLDQDRQWLKTSELNQVYWEKDALPLGLENRRTGGVVYGEIPHHIGARAYGQLLENQKHKALESAIRDNALERYRRSTEQQKQEPENERDHDQADDD